MIRRLPPERFSCHVAMPARSPMSAEFEAAGAHLHVVPMRRISTSHSRVDWLMYAVAWPLSVVRLWRLAKRVGADVVDSNSLHSWYGWAVARLGRVPHVWHAREIVRQSSAALKLERALARRFAVRVVAASEAVAKQLEGGNVRVVYDGVDFDEFNPSRAGAFRAAAGIADEVPLVGFVGRIDTWKGLDILLDGLPVVRRQLSHVELIVAGDTVAGKEDYADELRRRADELGGVHWLGPRHDVPELMADLDALAAPSTLPEPFGLVLVEALASGVPVVATNVGGAPEIVSRGRGFGLLVPPGDVDRLADAIVELLSWPMARTRPRERRKPLWDAEPPDVAALFDEVVEQGPPA
jgi:glycosyltransferase involved in cell wall biosynthesis